MVLLWTAQSLQYTTTLLWHDMDAVSNMGSTVLDRVALLAQEHQSLDVALHSFGVVQKALAEASRRWSAILLVQIMMLCAVVVETITVFAAFDKHAFQKTQALFAFCVAWPAALSLVAVVRANWRFDSLPRAALYSHLQPRSTTCSTTTLAVDRALTCVAQLAH